MIRNLARRLQPAALRKFRAHRFMDRFAERHGIRIVRRDLFYDLQRGHQVLRIHRDHEIYLQHMIESFDYYIDSVIPVSSGAANLVDLSSPRYHRLRGYGDIPFLFPSHTEPYRTTAEYLDFAALHGGEVVLDLGAYSAVTSIIFGQLVGPQGRVFAFEADDRNLQCAQVNVEMAASVLGVGNICLVPKAVWSNNGGLVFSHEGAMGSSAVSITGGHRGTETKVATARLQDFAAEHALTRIDFVKMDIEGCEIEVLRESAAFLHAMGARLIVEPHFVAGALSTDRCRDLLTAAGYAVRVREKASESEALIEATP